MVAALETYGPQLLEGFRTTVALVVLAMLGGFLVAIPLAAARFSRRRALRGLAHAYSWLFRGTPVLAQLFFVYYGAGQFRAELAQFGLWTWFRDPFFCAALTFALNSASYQSEILHGAIRDVPKAQRDAAHALGLSRWACFRAIILPQAALIAMRPLGNELILTVKASAIASVVTVLDLMGVTRMIYGRTFDLGIFIWAAAVYLVIVEAVRHLIAVAERRLARHLHLDDRRDRRKTGRKAPQNGLPLSTRG
jgi:polar amino acid transport system permease protein